MPSPEWLSRQALHRLTIPESPRLIANAKALIRCVLGAPGKSDSWQVQTSQRPSGSIAFSIAHAVDQT
jgi:hypothetical protein